MRSWKQKTKSDVFCTCYCELAWERCEYVDIVKWEYREMRISQNVITEKQRILYNANIVNSKYRKTFAILLPLENEYPSRWTAMGSMRWDLLLQDVGHSSQAPGRHNSSSWNRSCQSPHRPIRSRHHPSGGMAIFVFILSPNSWPRQFEFFKLILPISSLSKPVLSLSK